jgi:dihydroorotate dehydrogenase (fumarate)
MDTELTTNFGGLTLRSPIIVGACPLTAQEPIRIAIASAGAGAIVLPSIFQEEILRWNQQIGIKLNCEETRLVETSERDPSGTAYTDAESYLALVRHACSQSSIPIIASLNGTTVNRWIDFAGQVQAAGAAAIELKMHRHPPEHYEGAREIEDSIVDAVQCLGASISIPVFVKLGRDFTSISHLATRLLSGTQGLVLFGRSPQVDITLDDLQLRVNWGLTPPGSITQALASLMRVHAYCPAMPLAASGGISSACDVIKVLLAGADVAMVTSAIYREGPDVIRTYLDGLRVFLTRHQIASVQDLRGQRPIEFSSEDQRNSYKAAITSRLAGEATRTQSPTIRGDRYGHTV